MKRIILVMIAVFPLMSCDTKRDQRGIVSGSITYKGQPVNGAVLRLYPQPGPGIDISIPVTQEGTFRTSNVPSGEYKIVVESARITPQKMKTPALPKGLDPAKAEKMKQNLQQMQQEVKATIPYPKKYKSVASTDLKCIINEGEQTLSLELKD